jgi:biopolymer transport protein ExbD
LFARRSLAATATDPAATPTRALRVEVTADEIFVAGDPVTEAELTARIAAAVDAGAVEHVMLAADDQVEYGRLVSIMDAIRKGGAKDIALTTK